MHMSALAALTSTLAFAFAPAAMAAPAGPPSANGMAAAPPPGAKPSVAHVPVAIYENAKSNVDLALPAGETRIDKPASFTCLSKDGCTIIISTMASVSTATDDNDWTLCTSVDEVEISPCIFQGVLNRADSFRIGNMRQNAVVARGKHQIFTQVFASAPLTLAAFQFDYEVLTP
jgi:hypothetical protein